LWRSGAGLISPTGRRSAIASDTALWRRATGRRPLLDRNPVYWLTTRKSQLTWASWVLWAALVVGFAWFSCRDPTIAVAAGQYGWPILLGLLRIFVGVQACRFFAEARRAGALELLLCTPLTAEEGLRGQWMALRRLFFVPTIALLLVGIMPLISIIHVDMPNVVAWIMMGGIYLYAVPKLICDLLAAAWVGMLVGLTAKKLNFAPGLTVLYTVVLPVAAFCIPDVIISLPLLLWARDRLYRELRALSSPRYAPVAPLYSTGQPRPTRPPVIPG